MEVAPPQGLYWSYSLGNPWWETIDYGSHQSSLNGHQATVDDDGMLRAVIAHEDPGRRQLARHGRAQRRVRSFCAASAPRRRRCRRRGSSSSPTSTRGARRDPPGDAGGAAGHMAARRLAVSKRFCR